MALIEKAPAAATAQGLRKSDQQDSSIGSEYNAANGHAQAEPDAVAISTQRSVEDWRRIIADALGHAVENILAAGRYLQEAKDELPHGEFGPLVKSLGLGERTAQMLMKIAANEDRRQ